VESSREMPVSSIKIPLVGVGLMIAGVVWLFVFLLLEANAYMIVFPSAGLFFTGAATVGAWLALRLLNITGF